ncbi:hypothetical protein V9T40_000604 [Parthenolecanium corni]|uniref:TATA box-binding protein-like 1 n=1 Tax=Parthenolecanium corni TaxID=536013 RepID=A0AAN9TA30_9HEMI
MAEQFDESDCDLTIKSVSCLANLCCRLDLRDLAYRCHNVVLKNGQLVMKLRKPKVTVTLWSKGKLLCLGAAGENEARTSVRRVARIVQKAGFNVKLKQVQICNVTASCSMPFRIKISNFALHYKKDVSYEPEILQAARYKILALKANLTIFSTGIINILAPSVANVVKAAHHVYPMVKEFSRELSAADEDKRARKRMQEQRRLILQ